MEGQRAMREIMEEEEEVKSAASVTVVSSEMVQAAVGEVDVEGSNVDEELKSDKRRWFPCGRSVHFLRNPEEDREREREREAMGEGKSGGKDEESMRASDAEEGMSPMSDGGERKWKVGMFETRRCAYARVKLTRSMISDHLMVTYRRSFEAVMAELEKEREEEIEMDEDCVLGCG